MTSKATPEPSAPAALTSRKGAGLLRAAGYLGAVCALPALVACGERADDAETDSTPVATAPQPGGMVPPPATGMTPSPTAPGTTTQQPPAAGTTPPGVPAGTTMGTGVAAPADPVPAALGTCLNTGVADEDGNQILLARGENNYTFSSTLTIERTSVAPNTDLSFDWSALTTDFLGHGVDPMADVDSVIVVLFNLTQEEMTAKLNADELGASDSKGAVAIYTENMKTSGTTAKDPASENSLDFKVVGGGDLPHAELLTRFDPMQWDPATHTYSVMVQTGGIIGEGVHMVHTFGLDPAATNTDIVITPQSTQLQYQTSLTDLMPVQVPTGMNNILVDWSEMTLNALGREFVERSVDQVMVAKYSLTPAELEAQFLDLELIADEMYRAEVIAGEEQPLTDLVNETGSPFTGISADGTWILALQCSRCGNPAPWYITVLTPCG